MRAPRSGYDAALKLGWITSDTPPFLTELGEKLWKDFERYDHRHYVIDWYAEALREYVKTLEAA